MPRLVRQHNSEYFVEVELQHSLTRLLERRAVDLLPLVIQLLQLAGDCIRRVLVLAHQQLHTPDRVSQPPGGIEPGSEYEADPAGGQLLSIQTGGAADRAAP